MNQSDEKKKDNIQRVIETALDMFMENGVAATSMSQVAKKSQPFSDVSVPLLWQ